MIKGSKKCGSIIQLVQRICTVVLMLGIATLCLAASLLDENTFFVYRDDDVEVFTSEHADVATAFAESGILVDETEYAVYPEGIKNGVAKIYIHPKKKIVVKANGKDVVLYSEKEISVSELLKENNISVSEKEMLSVSGDEEIFDGMEFEIIPKAVVTLVVANVENILYTEPGVLVSELLSKNNISISENDIISVPLTETINGDIKIEITRISRITREETVSIPYSTVQRKNASLNKGINKTVQNGVNGSKKIIYEITITNGVETDKKSVSEVVITEPTPKIVEIGTKTSGTIKTKNGTLEYKDFMYMTATAYTTEGSSDKITATGAVARVGLVAVDRRVIPLGSRLYIEAADGKSWCYGIAVAGDTGVRGKKIDLFFNTRQECFSFGVRKAKVYILK